MAIVDTIVSGGKNLLGKFHYGPHPSIIMWKSVSAATTVVSDEGIVGSLRTKLESIVAPDGAPEGFQAFKFDAIVKEGHSAETIVTKFPVSSGFLVSDHVINQNRVLNLSTVAVNMQNSAMWGVSASGLSVVTGAIFSNPLFGTLGSLANTVVSAFETQDRLRSTFELFDSLRKSGTLLYISTIAGIYTNCVITKISNTNDKNTGTVLSMELTLEELQVVDPQNDTAANTARKAMENMSDYSGFAKMAASIGVSVLGGGGIPLPGLGSSSKPSDMLSTLKGKLNVLNAPVSAIKGRLL